MNSKNAKSAWEFLLTLGMYYLERLKEAGTKMAHSFDPWNVKTFVAGTASLVYLLGVAVFLAVLLYDGFAWRSERNFVILIVIGVVFIVSLVG